MSEPISALQGASFNGLVRVADAGLQGMITMRGDLSNAGFKKALKTVCNLDVPGQRGCIMSGERGVLWMSPDELLVLCPYGEATQVTDALSSALGSIHALAVNVSDARAVFHLSGPENAVRETIAKLAPVDMAPDVFASGEVRRTRLAQVAAAFWLEEDGSARIVCFRSVADYMFGILKVAADPNAAVNFLQS